MSADDGLEVALAAQDAFVNELQFAAFNLLVSSNKVPFTNAGIATVESALAGVMDAATNSGILSTDNLYTITMPDINDVSASDKASRLLKNVSINCQLAGAIHKINIALNIEF